MLLNLQWMTDFLAEHTHILTAMGVFSIVALLVWLFVAYFVFARLPVDYFSQSYKRVPMWQTHHWLIRGLLIFTKNLFAGILLVLGVVLLFTPGQGLLTIFVGILLLDFPGKYYIECWLVRRPTLRKATDWLRRKANQPPFLLDLE